jgi:hypothetical protein
MQEHMTPAPCVADEEIRQTSRYQVDTVTISPQFLCTLIVLAKGHKG